MEKKTGYNDNDRRSPRGAAVMAVRIACLSALSLSTLSLSTLSANALEAELSSENPRRIVSEYRLSVGRVDALSTYISPLNYHGFYPALNGAWSKGMPFDPTKWRMRFEAGLRGGQLRNSPNTAIQYTAGADFSWGMERNFAVGETWTFTAGGNVGFNTDAYWLVRNSNNPVSLSLRTGLSITGSVSYRCHFGRLPVVISERIAVPTLGVFFMPGYGESFYEIYLGNTSGLAHCGWWGNDSGVRSHLEFDLNFGRRSLTVGYLLDYNRQAANHLQIRRTVNALTLGLRY